MWLLDEGALLPGGDRDIVRDVLLPRAAGQKEARYAHCLSGEPEFDATPAPARASEPIRPPDGEDELRQRIAALEARVAALETAAATTIEQTGDTP